MKKFKCAILLVFFISSCSNLLTRDELIRYIGDTKNGCIQHSNIHNTQLSMVYRPNDIILYSEIAALPEHKQIFIDSIRNMYKNRMYFTLVLSYEDEEYLQKYIDNRINYTNLIAYLNYRITTDIQLIAGENVIQPSGCIFTRSYGISKSNNILFVFDNSDIGNVKTITINVNSKWDDLGSHAFHFKTKDLEKVPAIDFKNFK